MKMIDPPNGWKYGFPKSIPADVVDINKWLVENGYPKAEIDKYGDWFYCRHYFIPDGMQQVNKSKTNEDES
jgi:hypothetical protein